MGTSSSRKKKPSCSTDPKSVTLVARVREFPNETEGFCREHTVVLVLVLVPTTARTGYVALIKGVSQQEVTRLVVPLAVGTPNLSPHLHGPLS